MKLANILVFVALVSCRNITIAPKPVVAHSIAFSGNTQNAGIIDCTKEGCLVTSGWMSHYRKLEAKAKDSIGADAGIRQEGVNWRVSYEVMGHFLTLRQAERNGVKQ